jgi:RHS repeat-associated protein
MAAGSRTGRAAARGLASLGAVLLLLAGSPSRGAEVIEYYHLDAIGSVRAVTNGAGQVVERHDYLPFGEECTTGPCAANLALGGGQPRKFTGKERDAETGLDYFGARYYGSRIGRFTTVDPVYTWQENLLDPQRWNRYAYARNNPLRYVDPDGRTIRVADAGALALIQSTLPANLRSAVSLTKEGTIDAKALSSVQSSDANFRDLSALASHSGTVDVSTSAKATYKDASGNTKSDSFFYDSGADLAKYGLPPTPNLFLGVTLTPGDGSNPHDTSRLRSMSGNLEVILANTPGVPAREMQKTTAHELFGHALPYLNKQPFLHGQAGVDKRVGEIEGRFK